jgi:hypothetical protein
VPDSGKGSRPKANLATPEAFPIPTPQAPIDLGSIQHQLGRTTEAVETLKEQIKEHGKKIEDVRMDVHAAKVGGKILLWIVGAVGTLLGFFLAYFRQILSGGK